MCVLLLLQIEFRLFGLLPGSVALRGTVQPVGENEDTVKVFFQPPVLSIMNSIHIRIGVRLGSCIHTVVL